MTDTFVALDLEMTGLDPKKDRILEIGAVIVRDFQIKEQFQTFVNPHRAISPQAEALTGIRKDMVENAPEDVDGLKALMEFTGELPLVGHNILFDYRFLKQCAVNHNITYEKAAADTLKIARKCFPDMASRRLGDLCRYYHISDVQQHRACQDAWMTARLFLCLQQDFGDRYPELFQPKPLQYSVKKQGPLTPAQKRDLIDLISCHKIVPNIEIDSLTKSEASRMIDRIRWAYGKTGRTEGKHV